MERPTALINLLPPLAKQDLLDDLASGSTPDAELIEAIEITLAVHKRTGLDGEPLYDEVQKEVAKKYGIPEWTLSAWAAVGQFVDLLKGRG